MSFFLAVLFEDGYLCVDYYKGEDKHSVVRYLFFAHFFKHDKVGLKNCVSLTIILSTFIYLNAQEMPRVIPPSPEVSALAKYGEIPVSYNSGVPDISVLLYEFTAHDIKVPISISYHASGIRVSEKATSIGLGWALNCGGVISRTVENILDEAGYRNGDYERLMQYYNGEISPVDLPIFKQSLADGNIDTEPDVYYYNFLGRSGKIIFSHDEKPLFLPHVDLEIIPVKTGVVLNGYIIRDEAGFEYEFLTTESTKTYVDDMFKGTAVTGWYLSKISSPAGEEVYFDYLPYTTESKSRSASYSRHLIWESYCITGSCPQSTDTGEGTFTTSSTALIHSGKQISKIRSKNGLIYVDFHADTPREDSPFGNAPEQNGNRLDFFDVKTEASHNVLRSVNFAYSYFGSTAKKNKRLKLLSVTERSGLEQPKIHSFQYNENNELPPLHSYAQDHWGYYNGKQNDGSALVPAVEYSGLIASNQSSYSLKIPENGADREPHEESNKANVLTSITYPTGGKSIFEYQQHSFSKIFTGTQIIDPPSKIIQVRQSRNVSVTYIPGEPLYDESLIVIARTQTVSLNHYLRAPNSTITTPGVFVRLMLSGSNVPIYEKKLPASEETVSIILYPGTYRLIAESIADKNYSASAVLTYFVDQTLLHSRIAGGLRIKKITNLPGGDSPALVKEFFYTSDDGLTSSGLLLNDPQYITKKAEQTKLCKACEFPQYPGQVCCYEGFNYTLMVSSSSSQYVGVNDNNHIIYNSVTILEGGNNKTVIKYFSDWEDNVEEIVKTRSACDVGAFMQCPYNFIDDGMPGRKIPSTLFYAAQPVSQQFFRKTGNSYILIKETEAAYSIRRSAQIDIPGFQITLLGQKKAVCEVEDPRNPSLCNGPGDMQRAYVEHYYFYKPFWQQLNYSREIEYNESFPNDRSKANILETHYTYSDKHLKPVTIVKNDRANGNTVVKYRYVPDYDDAPANNNPTDSDNERAAQGLRLLKQKHIIDKVVEQYTYTQIRDTNGNTVDGNIISGMVATYLQDMPLLNKVYNFEATQPVKKDDYYESVLNIPANSFTWDPNYVDKIIYDQYDYAHNVLQVRKRDDNTLSYLWDHKSNYPVAQVMNASYTDIAHTSFEADGSGNFFLGNTQELNLTAPSGKSVYRLNGANPILKPGLDITKLYVVSYWANTASSLTIPGTIAGYPVEGSEINGWKYFKHLVTGQEFISIGNDNVGLIDEVRLYPVGAQMTTYTYDPGIGITSVTDPNGQVSYYLYDSFGRLVTVKDAHGKILKTFEYHYKHD